MQPVQPQHLPVITFTTDFGSGSSYVAQMKAQVLCIEPTARLIDITHAIQPQQIIEGAVVLCDVCHHFPAGTIHVAVVDPGVGTARPIIAARIGSQTFIAPDNGLLTLVAQRQRPERIVRLTRAEYWARSVSRTFHGRDIMAPAAALLASGLSIEQLGAVTDAFVQLDGLQPIVSESWIRGQCLIVDSFGNMITNVMRGMVPQQPSRVQVHIAGRVVPLVATYGEAPPGTLVALFGSSDRLEIAEVQGSASRRLERRAGCEIELRW